MIAIRSRRRAGAPHAGFTLVELVVSLSITSILLLGMSSVMMITSRSIPAADGVTAQTLSTDAALAKIAAEISEARLVTVATATAIEFTVADRDNPPDATDETFRYEWSGVAGDPLVWTVNGQAAVNLLPSVREFALNYQLQSASGEQQLAPVVQTAEQFLLQQDGSFSDGSYTTVGIRGDAGGTSRVAAGFQPSAPPADAIKWHITRVEFQADPAGVQDGRIRVRAREANDSGRPGQSETSKTVNESDLVAGAWHAVTYTAPPDFAIGEVGFVSFEYLSGDLASAAAELAIKDGVTSTPETLYYKYSDGSWSEDASRDIRITVFGNFSIPDPAWTPAEDQVITAVGITANAGTDSRTRARARAATLNRPEKP